MDKRLILLLALIGTCFLISPTKADDGEAAVAAAAPTKSTCDEEIGEKLCAAMHANSKRIAKLSDELTKAKLDDKKVPETAGKIAEIATQLKEMISKCDVCEEGAKGKE